MNTPDDSMGGPATAPAGLRASAPSQDTAWKALHEAGLVGGERPTTETDMPWYVRVMLGIAGWFAAFFLLGFIAVALSWVVENEAASVVVGLLLVAVSGWGMRRLGEHDFFEQAALAFSFTGQALFAFGLFELFEFEIEEVAVWLVLALFQAALAWLMPSSIHRAWSAFAAAWALAIALFNASLAILAAPLLLLGTAVLWLNSWRFPERLRATRACGYGLALALATTAHQALGGPSGLGLHGSGALDSDLPAWLGSVLTGAVLLWLVHELCRRVQPGLDTSLRVLALLGAAGIALLSAAVGGLAAGVSLLLLGFHAGNRLLTGLGVLALLVFLSHYYYTMDTTLLVKSAWLGLSGIVLLAIRWLLLRKPKIPKGESHA